MHLQASSRCSFPPSFALSLLSLLFSPLDLVLKMWLLFLISIPFTLVNARYPNVSATAAPSQCCFIVQDRMSVNYWARELYLANVESQTLVDRCLQTITLPRGTDLEK